MISVKVNGAAAEVPRGYTVLQACTEADVYVPSLCNHPDIPPAGKCGICVVKINSATYSLACTTRCQEGMSIDTTSPDVRARALTALNEFNDMALMPNSKEIEDIWKYFTHKAPVRGRQAEKTNALAFDPSLCINCGRCERMCSETQNIGALDEDSHSLNENECIQCGMCVTVCPTNALTERSSTPTVLRALAQGKNLVLQVSPSTRVSLGDLFGEAPGNDVTGKLISAARQIGFKYVIDAAIGADLTAATTLTEFNKRLKEDGPLPMFTSSCPAWVNLVEKIKPELIPYLSHAKPPHSMLAAAARPIVAKMLSVPIESLFIVSLSNCAARKDEITRETLEQDVHASLTAKEFASLLTSFGVIWHTLPEGTFDALPAEDDNSENSDDYVSSIYASPSPEGLTAELPSIHKINGAAAARAFTLATVSQNKETIIDVLACPKGCVSGGGSPKSSKKTVESRIQSMLSLSLTAGTPTSLKVPSSSQTDFMSRSTPYLEMRRRIGSAPIVAFTGTGAVSRFARSLAALLGATAAPVSQYSGEALSRRGAVILIGDIPFTDPLPQPCRFAILAIGTRCSRTARNLDATLAKSGQRLVPIGEIDYFTADRGEGSFETWAKSLMESLGLPIREGAPTPPYSVSIDPSPTGILERPLGFGFGVMLSSSVLSPSDFLPQTHRYQLKLPPGTGYSAGWRAQILPQNDQSTVDAVLTALHIDPRNPLLIETPIPDGENLIPRRLTAKQLFSQYLDLSCAPTRAVIRVFRDSAKNADSLGKFNRLLEPRKFDELTEDSSVGEFIVEYSRFGTPTLESLVSSLPHIRPRTFCVASAPSSTSRSIDIIVADISFGPGNTRGGLATGFLRRFGLTKVAVKLERGLLNYPTDQAAPILMYAEGTGISGMLSMLQHRESLTGESGRAALFFTCDSRESFAVLEGTLHNYQELGALQDLIAGEGDVLNGNDELLWNYWQNPKAVFMYCGKGGGEPERFRECLISASVKRGGMTREQAERFCSVHPFQVESYV